MEEKRRFLQLLALSTGPALDTVQHYFENKIIGQGRHFEHYLNDPNNKHMLFHECFPKIPCCSCKPESFKATSVCGSLSYRQYSLLFDENGFVNVNHEKKRDNIITEHCLCKVSAKQAIKVTDTDLTLLNAIITHCEPAHKCKQILRWMKEIKEVMDTFSNLKEEKLDETQFDQNWKKVKTATLECARDIGDVSLKIFQKNIDQITTCSVADLGGQIFKAPNQLPQVCYDNYVL